jgi:hypothetical protein
MTGGRVSTQRTYATYLPRWSRWCADHGIDPARHTSPRAVRAGAVRPSVAKEIDVDIDERIPVTPHLLTLPEAAAYLRTPIATLRYWRHVGSGPQGYASGDG